MKRSLLLSITGIVGLMLSSFLVVPKPHLIVGNWGLMGDKKQEKIFIKDRKEYAVEILAFASDEITSSLTLTEKGKKDGQKINFAFKIWEPFDEFKTPVILMKNLCDDKSRMVFSVLQLDKAALQLKFERKYSSENISITDSILNFERTAGPPENMP